MYYFLEKVIIGEKKDYSLRGTLYDNNKNKVNKVFDDGLPHKELAPPFLLVLDETRSLTSKRVLTDKISSSGKGSGLLFLVSRKTQKLFSELLSQDIQMFEVLIKGSNFELSDYKIIKILDKIDCVDLEKSDVDYDEDFNSIDSAESIILNEEKIPKGKLIFLLGQREAGVIVIHEELKKAIESAGLTGFKFYKLDEAYMLIA